MNALTHKNKIESQSRSFRSGVGLFDCPVHADSGAVTPPLATTVLLIKDLR